MDGDDAVLHGVVVRFSSGQVRLVDESDVKWAREQLTNRFWSGHKADATDRRIKNLSPMGDYDVVGKQGRAAASEIDLCSPI